MKIRFHIFFTLLWLMASLMSAQTKNNNTYLKSLKDYREMLLKKISMGDTAKEMRCKEKTTEYLALKKRYLHKLDSMDKLITEKNSKGSSSLYVLIISKPVYYQWEDCETRVIKEGENTISVTYGAAHDSGTNTVDSHLEIGKEDKLRVNSGFSSGQTYYREDLK